MALRPAGAKPLGGRRRQLTLRVIGLPKTNAVPAAVGLQTGRRVRGYLVSHSCGIPSCKRGKFTRWRGGEGNPIPALSPDLSSSRAIFGRILVFVTSGNLFKTAQFQIGPNRLVWRSVADPELDYDDLHRFEFIRAYMGGRLRVRGA